MAKIVLNNISTENSVAKTNENMEKVADHLNNRVLYRKNIAGEENQMETHLDMNSYRIYNLPKPLTPLEPVRLIDIGDISFGPGDISEDRSILKLNKLISEDKIVYTYQDALAINPTIAPGVTVSVEPGAMLSIVDSSGSKGEKGDKGDPGTGESNTASNLGSGAGVFSHKDGVDLKFKSISAGSNVTITDMGTNILVSASSSGGTGESTLAANMGGTSLYSYKAGNTLYFRGITAGSGVRLSEGTNSVTISSVVISSIDPGPVGPGVIWVVP